MYVGNEDGLRVKAGQFNLSVEANQPLSSTRTAVVKQMTQQPANSAELEAIVEMEKSILRESQKQDRLAQFQQRITERAAAIQKENRIKKAAEERIKEEKKQTLLSRNKKIDNDSFVQPPRTTIQAAADKRKQLQQQEQQLQLQEQLRQEQLVKPGFVFKPNVGVTDGISQQQQKSVKQAGGTENKPQIANTKPQHSNHHNHHNHHKSKKEKTGAQVLFPVAADQEQNEEESEDEIDYDICNFNDAEEATQKFADIREHLYALTHVNKQK